MKLLVITIVILNFKLNIKQFIKKESKVIAKKAFNKTSKRVTVTKKAEYKAFTTLATFIILRPQKYQVSFLEEPSGFTEW
jgi:hypothetical protein